MHAAHAPLWKLTWAGVGSCGRNAAGKLRDSFHPATQAAAHLCAASCYGCRPAALRCTQAVLVAGGTDGDGTDGSGTDDAWLHCGAAGAVTAECVASPCGVMNSVHERKALRVQNARRPRQSSRRASGRQSGPLYSSAGAGVSGKGPAALGTSRWCGRGRTRSHDGPGGAERHRLRGTRHQCRRPPVPHAQDGGFVPGSSGMSCRLDTRARDAGAHVFHSIWLELWRALKHLGWFRSTFKNLHAQKSRSCCVRGADHVPADPARLEGLISQ